MSVNQYAIDRLILRDLPWGARALVSMLSRIKHGSLTLVDPQGRSVLFGKQGQWPHATLKIHDWRAAWALIRQGDIGFAHAFRNQWVDCPDLVSLFRLAIRNESSVQTVHGNWWSLLVKRVTHWVLRDNNRNGSRRNIVAHYDLGNSFYRLWLDESMSYSAALFGDRPDGDLHQAQLAKYDRLLDMIQAKPGQHILEIGCGWGAFARRAVQRGLKVTGVTLSDEQLAWCKSEFDRLGYQSQANFLLCDYRDIQGQYDHIVSIEMFEAVGLRHWPTFFKVLGRLLKPEGRVAIQTIDIADDRFDGYVHGTDFIQQYIFPGGMLPSPSRFSAHAQQAQLRVADQFSFGLDYAETLNRWSQRFDDQLAQVAELGFDDAFIRIWQMYLAYCEAGFRERRTDVKQWLLTHRQA